MSLWLWLHHKIFKLFFLAGNSCLTVITLCIVAEHDEFLIVFNRFPNDIFNDWIFICIVIGEYKKFIYSGENPSPSD